MSLLDLFRRSRLMLHALLAAPILGLCWAAAALAQPADVTSDWITQANVLASNAFTIPDMALQPSTSLPDDWSETRPQAAGGVWYHAAFEAPLGVAADDSPALYIERACSNVEVHLNGKRIFTSGRVREPVSRNCPYPQLVPLPHHLLQDSGNVLDLRVHGHAYPRVAAVQRAGGLSAMKVGTLAQLNDMYQTQLFWRVTAVQIGSGLLGMLGVVMLVLGWSNRKVGHEWGLGWLLLGWALLSVRLWVRDTPLDNAMVEFLSSAGLALLAALAAVFLLRYARWTYRPLELGLLAQCLVLPMTMLLAGPNRVNLMSTVWTLLLSVEVFAAMGLYLALTWAQRRSDCLVMLPIMAAVAGLLLMELGVQHHLRDMPPIDFTQLGLSAVLMAVSLRVLAQYASASAAAAATVPNPDRQAEFAHRKRLESRLQQLNSLHERALLELARLRGEDKRKQEHARAAAAATEVSPDAERQLARLAEARVEQVTAQERKRIAADLHDDLGAKLLTIVHTSESDHISTLAREALEEMRLSVRGLSGKPMQLGDALADWRSETVARLSQASIEIDWRGPTEEVDQTLAARSFVQTTRILREAISNVIKHSGASQCKVRCGIRGREFGLIVQDNGNGISMDMDGKLDRGHGMASMKNRAKQMQGQCLVESGPGYGTVIRLTLPL
jgi:two-component system sensor histidine kinase UhpB